MEHAVYAVLWVLEIALTCKVWPAVPERMWTSSASCSAISSPEKAVALHKPESCDQLRCAAIASSNERMSCRLRRDVRL